MFGTNSLLRYCFKLHTFIPAMSVRTDSRTVNVIAQGCLSKLAKIKVAALRFFVGIHDDKSIEDETPAPRFSNAKEVQNFRLAIGCG